MRQVTVYTTDKDYGKFIDLAKNLKYIKKIETDDEPNKEQLISEITEAVEELNQIKAGKKIARNVEDFINEL